MKSTKKEKIITLNMILDELVRLEVIRSKEIQKIQKPTHGPCCTCQDCGRHYDDCICFDNEIIIALYRLYGALDK